MKVKVRSSFCVRLGESLYPEGTELEVTAEQFDLIKHQVEEVAGKQPAAKKEA